MSGRPVGASALLLVLRHSCWCLGTSSGATALLLHEQARPDWCSGTPAGATALLLREQARPDWCSGTPASATARLLHEQARPDWCSDTPAGATTLLFCIVPSGTYYTASYSFFMTGLGSQTNI